MNEDRTRTEVDSQARAATRRRATSALVANYLHELSERHGGGTRGSGGREPGERDEARDRD
jgi:hypothetical protein